MVWEGKENLVRRREDPQGYASNGKHDVYATTMYLIKASSCHALYSLINLILIRYSTR